MSTSRFHHGREKLEAAWEQDGVHHLIEAKKAEIADACRRHGIIRLSVFGSAARGYDFDPAKSDADFLVDFGPSRGRDPYLHFKDDVEAILHCRADILDRAALEDSRNYIRRRSILADAELVFAA